MPKLLIVTTVPATIEAFLLPFAQHFRALGWQVDALAQGLDQDIRPRPDWAGCFDNLWSVQWSRNPLDPANLITAVPRIQAVAQQNCYDIIHVHTPVAAFVTRFALRHLRKQLHTQVIYTAHGFHFHTQGSRFKNILYQWLEQQAAPWCDHLVTINQTDYQAARSLFPPALPHSAIHYMPGIGVDLDQYQAQKIRPDAIAALRDEIGVLHSPLLLCIAEMIPRKRHGDLLRAFAQGGAGAHLLLAGDGPLWGELMALAQRLGVGDRVHFLGQRRDIPVLVGAARAVLLVSEQEGLPRSVLESLALGTPVIGTRIRGIADLLQEPNSPGITVPLGDVGRLAEAIAWMLAHPQDAAAMGQQGRTHLQPYALPQVIRRHHQLYAQALGRDITPLPQLVQV
jgi:glycosyltransferase involved in cell wall biosynthesis